MRFSLCLFLILFGAYAYTQAPTEGLVAHYPFNGSANDVSGNNNNGQLNGGIVPTTDRLGNPCGAFRFIGEGTHISIPNSVSLKSPASSLAITVWVKPEPTKGTNDLNLILLAKPGIESGADIKPQYCFQLKRVFGDNYSTITLSSDYSFQDKQYNNHPMEFNRWYFLAVTYDENFVQVYQDGKLIAQAPKNKPFLPNDFALEIGRDIVAGKRYFNGCMDDLRIYNRGLTQVDVNALFADKGLNELKDDIIVNMPKTLEKNTLTGKCYAPVFYAEPTITMGCGSEVLKQVSGQPSGSQFAVGHNKLVYETSIGDKRIIDSFEIIVADNEPPAFNCAADVVVKGNATGAEVFYPQLTVTDNCPNLRLELLEGKTSGSIFPLGTTTLKYRATDAAGNSSECLFKVIVTQDAQQVREVAREQENKPQYREETVAQPEVHQPTLFIQPVEKKVEVKETRKPDVATRPVKDNEPPHFKCPKDTVILLPPNRRGLVYHYKMPVVTDNVGVDSIEQIAGSKDGCFLQIGVHPFIFKAFDKAGNTETCIYSVMIKEDASAAKAAPPQKLDAALAIGNDSVHYEHNATVNNCELTFLIYDDGEQDNDSVSIIFNDELIVNRDMIKIKENGAIKRTVSLIPGEENFIIAKAWNTGRYGLNTLRIDVYETPAEGDKKDLKNKKPVTSKILHSKPGAASGMLLMCK